MIAYGLSAHGHASVGEDRRTRIASSTGEQVSSQAVALLAGGVAGSELGLGEGQEREEEGQQGDHFE